MTRPWVVFLAGLSGLFLMVVLTRQSHSPSSSTNESGARVARLPQKDLAGVNEPSGWLAKPDSGSQPGGSAGTSQPGKAGSRSLPAGSHDSLGSGGRGSAAVIGDGGRAGGSVSLGGSSGAGSSGDVKVEGAIPAAKLPFDLNKPASSTSGAAAATDTKANPSEPNASGDATKPEEQDPVLALSFDKTTQPEKGDTAPVAEQGITFDGQGARFDVDSQFVIPDAANVVGENGTISFCVQPGWSGSQEGDASFVNMHTPNVFGNRMQITKNGQYLRFLMADNTGQEANTGLNISGWQPGERHLVTTTWGDALASMYVDGQLVGQQTYQGQMQLLPGTSLYIGSDMPGGIPGANGTLSNFQVYNRILPGEEVVGLTSGCGP